MNKQTIKQIKRIQNIANLLDQLINDPLNSERIDKQLCKACMYFVGWAGQGFTKSKCHICNKEIMNPSTDTAYLCLECAKEHNLCVSCGADLNYNIE